MRKEAKDNKVAKLKARTLQFISLLGISAQSFQEMRMGQLVKNLTQHVGIFRVAGIADSEKEPVSLDRTFGFTKSPNPDCRLTLPIIQASYTEEEFLTAIADLRKHAKIEYRDIMESIFKSLKIDGSSQFRLWSETKKTESKSLREFKQGIAGLAPEIQATVLAGWHQAHRKAKKTD